MIQIIKEGKIVHKHTCGVCGCVFSFDPEDVTIRTRWDDHGGHYPVIDFYEIDCPFCKGKIGLSEKDFNKDEVKQMKHIDD